MGSVANPIPFNQQQLLGNSGDVDASANYTCQQQAQAELRHKNKKQFRTKFTIPGDCRVRAGQVVTLSGFGIFDGNWIVERLRHKIAPKTGYQCELDLRACMPY